VLTQVESSNEQECSCRHTQGTEGEALLALFPKGIKVLQGGVKGALKSAEDKTAPKLYCVSGKRRFKVSSVPVEAASLNSRDGFVLDCGSEDLIVQWVNTDASPALKFRTLDLADELEQEYHGGNATVSILTTS
jgi:Gelsolin repeat